jgi:hypothetical protein
MNEERLALRASGIADFPRDAVTYDNVLDVYGGKQVLLMVKGNALADYARNQLDGLYRSSFVADECSEFKEGKITAIIDSNGDLTEYTAEIAFDMEIGKSMIAVVQKSTVTNIRPGRSDIDFPSDLGSYSEFAPKTDV